MAILQPIIDLVALCVEQGITYAVISPGSRSAALAMAFARNSGIKTVVVMDERSAGFIALGIAQQLQRPVTLICTSGSAGYNFAPAVVEAYFQHIPLLVLTADRPKEWIHQQDGQTIFQTDLYGKHTKKSFELLSSYAGKDAHWYINRVVNEAIILTNSVPFGPVHINIPIEEPFYPLTGEVYVSSPAIRKITKQVSEAALSSDTWNELAREWNDQSSILVAAGQQEYNSSLSNYVNKLAERIPVVGDIISNFGNGENIISKHESFLSDDLAAVLRPGLLITFGKSFISKSFKEFIRKNKPQFHWHIGEDVNLVDTFQTLTRQIPVSPEYFFGVVQSMIENQVLVNPDGQNGLLDFYTSWQQKNRLAEDLVERYVGLQTELSDLTVFDFLLKQLPVNSQLHVANSMSIRYVNILGIKGKEIEVFANRGTSGIDGCVSTAIGAALVNNKETYLLVGDVAFLYDRNGFLINSLPDNLKIIIINNQGGTIFRLIDGPSRQPELSDFFETRHQFSAERTAADSGIVYFSVREQSTLKKEFEKFELSSKISILEIFTDPVSSATIFKGLKEYLRTNS